MGLVHRVVVLIGSQCDTYAFDSEAEARAKVKEQRYRPNFVFAAYFVGSYGSGHPTNDVFNLRARWSRGLKG